ncbi:MAG: hypothetical protein KC733_09570, partial [Candidatus Omnitrophica bacterium]|nr:hypothetical protein [Candidatus Omnitrophota bacterium]
KVKVYRNNTELWTALMRQEIDMADYISREDFQVIQKDPDFKAHAVNWTMYCALLYDLIDPVLVDLDVRRAIAYAISRQEIINNLSEFGGLESTGPFHPESIGYNPDVQALEYNPVKSKMLLMHRGWVLNPSSGILEKEGRQFVINVLIDQSSDLYKKIVLNMRQQLAQLGIRLNVVYYNDESELTPEFLKEHHVQAWLRFFQGLGVDPYEAIDSWYSLTTQFGNIWPYKNTKVDELLLLGKIAQEEASKKAIYQQAHQLIYADQPACFLFYPASLFAVNSNFKNTDAYFSRYQATYTIKNWYIKTK